MKKKILILIGFSVFAVWICIAFFIYQDTKRELESVLDAQLKQSAKVLLEVGSHELRELGFKDENNLNFADTSDDDEDEHQLAFQIRNHAGILLLRSSRSIPETPFTNIDSGFDNQNINNELWRIYSQWTRHHDLQVQVAQNISFRHGITTLFRHRLLLPIFIFLPILLIFVFLSINSGLKPFAVLSKEIKNRGPKDLKQIDTSKYPVEITPIVTELNQLLHRLLVAIDAEKRLTADAAHELRTPLAALKVQTQVALEASDITLKNNSLKKINEVIDGLSRRVSQLLMLAKLDSESFLLEKTNCDLNLILKNELALQTPKILEKDINIFFEDHSCFLAGYPDLLAILARNLIENAIKYTPQHGEIKVLLTSQVSNSSPTKKYLNLKVIDSGPGINEADLPHLFERFYKPKGSNKEGSGLGLSIVKKIVELHHAQLSVYNHPKAAGDFKEDQTHQQDKAENKSGLVVDIEFI